MLQPKNIGKLAMSIMLTTSAAANAAFELEEVVVSARKVEESLQSTPVAVTAISGEVLQEKQIIKMADLQRSTPGMSTGSGGLGPASLIYASIRGQSQNSPNSVTDAAVGIYIDGVYMGRPIASNMGFLDVGQVEVLRGPQGTLFGRNTTGGAIVVSSNRPTDEFEGHVKAQVGNYNLKHLEAVVNLPITDSLASRVAFSENSRDGYVDNPITDHEHVGVDKSYSARASLLYTPDEDPITVFFSLDHDYYRDSGTPGIATFNDSQSAVPGLIPPLGVLFGALGLNPRDYEPGAGDFFTTYGNVQSAPLDPRLSIPGNYLKATGVTFDIEIELSNAELKAITAYRESVSSNQNDIDASPVDLLGNFTEYKQHQFSQELQLSWSVGDLNLIAGAYHFEEGGDESAKTSSFGVFNQLASAGSGLPIVAFSHDYRDTYATFSAKSQGAFIQGNYAFTDQLRLTAGYRFTKDSRSVVRMPLANYIPQTSVLTSSGPVDNPVRCNLSAEVLGITPAELAVLPLSACRHVGEGDFSYPSYLISLDYQLNDDTLLYLKHSRASMAGSMNTRDVPAGYTYDVAPETVKDVEFGVKADLFDRKVRANAAVFYLEGEDVQRIVNGFIPGSGTTQFNANAGDTEVSGLEVELTALLMDDLELTASLSLMDGKYKKGSFIENQGTQASPIWVDRSGETLPRLPEMTYSVGLTKHIELDIGHVSAHLDYSYIDDQAINVQTAAPGSSAAVLAAVERANQLSTFEGYGLLSARLSLLTGDDDNIELSLWGSNLTDEEYYTASFNLWTSIGFVSNYQGSPRTFGGSIQYNF